MSDMLAATRYIEQVVVKNGFINGWLDEAPEHVEKDSLSDSEIDYGEYGTEKKKENVRPGCLVPRQGMFDSVSMP